MTKERILVIGASGQIGVELTLALRGIYGNENVVASDMKAAHPLLAGKGLFIPFDVLDKDMLRAYTTREKITQIYLLAALLSATGEKNPALAWKINMQSLLNVLDIAKEKNCRVFWPSSIAVFGHSSPKVNCPQETIMQPETVYGISKHAGELWCEWYYRQQGVDVRSIRYPGLISYKARPGGGTTDYAIDIFHKAITEGHYNCFLKEDTRLPMLYMEDAVRATLELMNAPAEKLTIRTSYNIAGVSFTPAELAQAIRHHKPGFTIDYQPDYRQAIAESWPGSIDDSSAKKDWGWKPAFDLQRMTRHMYAFISGEYIQAERVNHKNRVTA